MDIMKSIYSKFVFTSFFCLSFVFIGCVNAEKAEVSENNNKTEIDLKNKTVEDLTIITTDTTLEDYIEFAKDKNFSISECLRISKEISNRYTGMEGLTFLKECYLKDSSSVILNMAVSKSYLFAYEYEGNIVNKKRAEEILNYTLNFDTAFNNYKEFNLDQESLLKFLELWSRSDDTDKENLMTWALLMDFDMESDYYKIEVKNKW